MIIRVDLNGLFPPKDRTPVNPYRAAGIMLVMPDKARITIDKANRVIDGYEWVMGARFLEMKSILVEAPEDYVSVRVRTRVYDPQSAVRAVVTESVEGERFVARVEARAKAARAREVQRNRRLRLAKAEARSIGHGRDIVRSRQVWMLRRCGATFAEIASKFGITKERVRQIDFRAECEQADQRLLHATAFSRSGIPDLDEPNDSEWHIWTPESNARELGLI